MVLLILIFFVIFFRIRERGAEAKVEDKGSVFFFFKGKFILGRVGKCGVFWIFGGVIRV